MEPFRFPNRFSYSDCRDSFIGGKLKTWCCCQLHPCNQSAKVTSIHQTSEAYQNHLSDIHRDSPFTWKCGCLAYAIHVCILCFRSVPIRRCLATKQSQLIRKLSVVRVGTADIVEVFNWGKLEFNHVRHHATEFNRVSMLR